MQHEENLLNAFTNLVESHKETGRAIDEVLAATQEFIRTLQRIGESDENP